MLITFVKLIHILTCLVLIVVVLLQADKGEGLGGAFGAGGGGALFGKRGATGTIARVTCGAAVVFMFTSFYLGWKGAPTKGGRKTSAIQPAVERSDAIDRRLLA